MTQESKNPLFSFETAMKDLESVVHSLESGKLSLEESLAAFEKGVKLSKECQQALSDAKIRVEKWEEKLDNQQEDR